MGRDRKATWMAKFEIPIRDAVETVEFPDGWQVNWAPIADVPVGDDGAKATLVGGAGGADRDGTPLCPGEGQG